MVYTYAASRPRDKRLQRQPVENPFVTFIETYHDRPVEFCVNVLGITPDPPQRQLLEDIAAGERHIAIKSGHGTGKSSGLAMAATWYACTRINYKVVMTAPTSPQLFDALWSETKMYFRRLPAVLRELFEIKSERIELKSAPEEGFISVRTSNKEKPEALAGIHADNVLLMADEASAIPEEIFESAAGSMSGQSACTILTGNPTRLSGLFYRAFNDLKDEWKTATWNSEKSPRVSPLFIQQIIKTYGADSNQYRVRVLGEFPLTDEDKVISRPSVEAAMERDIVVDPTARRYWALDVARYGTDNSVLCERMGNVVPWLEVKSNLSTMNIAGWVKSKWDELPAHLRPKVILVDVIGVGAGVVDRLLEFGLPVRGVNVAESALVFSDGWRLRDQLWLDMKKWFESNLCKVPRDRALVEELVSPSYSFMSNGKTKIESKEEMKRRGARSPDRADAIALTFAEDPATLQQGPRRENGSALKRNLIGYG